MSALRYILSSVVFVLLCQLTTQAQWVQMNGPKEKKITCLAIGDTEFYAGTLTGVFASTDNGYSWSLRSEGFSPSNVTTLTTRGNLIFAGTTSGVYVSTNRGMTWNPSKSAIEKSPIRVMALGEKNLIVATDSNVFSSTDNGLTWGPVDPSLQMRRVHAMAADGKFMTAGGSTALYISQDDGNSWETANRSLESAKNKWAHPFEIHLLAANGTAVLLATDWDGVFLSTDQGKNWSEPKGVEWQGNAFALSDSLLCIAGDYRIYFSTNKGACWYSFSKWADSNVITALVIKDAYLLAGTLGNGIWRCPLNDLFKTCDNLSGKIDLEMVYIPGGTVEHRENDGTVIGYDTISSFSISSKEITNRQFARFLNQYQSASVKGGTYCGEWMIITGHGIDFKGNHWKAQPGLEDCPIASVSWYGANEFCRFYGYRLPTVAEWEFCAQEGNAKRDWKYHGTTWDELLTWSGFPQKQSKDYPRIFLRSQDLIKTGGIPATGSKNRNSLGVYDIPGYIWEWCSDGDESSRAIRGFEWYIGDGKARGFLYEKTIDPSIDLVDPELVGFRCVQDSN